MKQRMLTLKRTCDNLSLRPPHLLVSPAWHSINTRPGSTDYNKTSPALKQT
jgi:hypothetical protein